MRSLRRGRNIALLLVFGTIAALVATAIVHRNELLDLYRACRYGYRYVWMPEGIEAGTGDVLNSSGDVAVIVRRKGTPRAALWSARTKELSLPSDPPGEDVESISCALNERGTLAGRKEDETLFLRTRDGRGRDFTPSNVLKTSPSSMNNRDEVVGTVRTLGWRGPRSLDSAFMWSPRDGFRDLDAGLSSQGSSARGINESSWVVGSSTTSKGTRPFLWRPEWGTLLLNLPERRYIGGAAVAINERGDVLINVWTTRRGENDDFMLADAFIWNEKDGFRRLPAPHGYKYSRALCMNERGDVLLRANQGDPRDAMGFLVSGSGGELIELPDAPGAEYTLYDSLNDRGWLLGRARMDVEDRIAGSTWRGFVAKPFW